MKQSRYVVEEPLTVYKKCLSEDNTQAVVELEIPAGATVIEPCGWIKCRTNKAVVKKIYIIHARVCFGTIDSIVLMEEPDGFNTAYSVYRKKHNQDDFKYIVGSVVESDLNEDPYEVCSEGIHFFKSIEDATRFWWEDSGCNYLPITVENSHFHYKCYDEGSYAHIPAYPSNANQKENKSK